MSSLLGDIIPNQRLSLLDFVEQANHLLPRFLPESSIDSRQREEVNVRLVRHMTTLGLLDEALREGREARYTGTHLLQLLVVRRLMAEGYTTGAIKKLIAGASIERLEALLEGEAQPTVEVMASLVLEESAPLSRQRRQAGDQVQAEQEVAREESSVEEQTAGGENPALEFLHKLKGRKAGQEGGNERGRDSPSSAPIPRSAGEPLGAASPSAPAAQGANAAQGTPPPVHSPVVSARPAAPLHWVRVEVLPGLEVHVREDFALPVTPHEQERLLQRIAQELKVIRAGTTPASKRRSP